LKTKLEGRILVSHLNAEEKELGSEMTRNVV